jgi:dTDP-4-amino-4,6-dideoxygalactose transaminase
VIAFHSPYISGRETEAVARLLQQTHFSGNGPQNSALEVKLANHFAAPLVVLTPSATSALELAALLAGIGPGDEVIMPSFTFPSTATAVTLLGGCPVFVDIDPKTFNLDPIQIERAITPQTKAICPVHYAGTSCDMASIMEVANQHELIVIEDAAHAIGSFYRGEPTGKLGHFSAFSFHDSKNIHCGEGGALVVNRAEFLDRAKIARDKGTDRSRFMDGLVDKYTWQARGSSYLMSEFHAVVLQCQLEDLSVVTKLRTQLWKIYEGQLKKVEAEKKLRLLEIPNDCTGNGHLFAIVLNSSEERRELQTFLKINQVETHAHYSPLHSSPAGIKLGRSSLPLLNTERYADSLLRLPLHTKISKDDVLHICDLIEEFFKK